jgi:hypothetical protein
MHFNSPTIYFQVSGTLLLALRMEANLLIALVALQILMALGVMVLKITTSGSRENSRNWNIQMESLPTGMFWVVAFC